jgi:hypothetical protein
MIGKCVWVIADGWIPPASNGPEPEMLSHDSACILNTNSDDTEVELFVYFTDREPVGPYTITVPARRTFHQRINDLTDPESVPRGVDYSIVLISSLPVVVQHTRLDSRQAENALMTTIGYSA